MGLFGNQGPSPSMFGAAYLSRSISDNPNNPALGPLVYAPAGSPSVPLGFDPHSPDHVLPWNLTTKRGHSLCFSSTGGGKNTNLITPALLTYAGNVFCLDPKGENAWITADRRRQLGQRVVILDPWDKVNETYGSKVGVTEQVSQFNPLSSLDPSSADFNDDIMLIADGVIITSERADPHWSESARELISGLIAAAVERAPGIASFRDVRELLTADDASLARAVQKIVAANPASLGGRKLRRFAATPKVLPDGTETFDVPKEITSIRSTAMTQTAIFDAARLLHSMETGPDAFDLSELVTGRTTVFVVLPADKLLTHGRWMRLIIQLALRAIARQPTPPQLPVLLLLDELGTINPGGGLRMIEQAYGLLGGMGIRVWGFFQTLDQLQHDYPSSWKSFIGNSECIQIIRVNDADTAQYFSNHIGMATWVRHPGGQWQQSRDGKIKTKNVSSVHWQSGGASVSNQRMESQVQSRPAIMGQELMELDDGEIVSVFSGKGGKFRLPSLPYYLDRRLAGMFRPNPLFPAPVQSQQAQGFQPLISDEMKARAAALGSWLKADAKVSATKAKDAASMATAWAKSDGVEHARKAAAAASDMAGKASRWWKARKGSPAAPDASEGPPADAD